MMTPDNIDVWVRLDVVEGAHHAHALDRDGDTLYDKPLKQDEKAIRSMLEHLSRRGRVLLVVDQPNTIGSLPLTVARDMGIAVAYLPSTAMRRTAQLPPETLRDAGLDDETLAALKLLVGHDEDLAHESTRYVNRLRSLLLQTHPAFERALKGERITREATLALLERYGGPAGMKRAGVEDVKDWAKSNGLRAGRIIDDMFKAIGEQTVTVPGVVKRLQIRPHAGATNQSIIASCEGSVCMYVVFQMRKALVCACNNSQYSGGVRLQNSRCCDSLSANSGECTIPPMMR